MGLVDDDEALFDNMIETRRRSCRILTKGLEASDETLTTPTNGRRRQQQQQQQMTKTKNNKDERSSKSKIAKKSKNETQNCNSNCNQKMNKKKKKKLSLNAVVDVEKPNDDKNLVNDNVTEKTHSSYCCIDDGGQNGLFNSYNDEIIYINKMIENLLKTSEANSLIVCGDAGVGKTKLIETCLTSFPVLSSSSSLSKSSSSSSSLNHHKNNDANFKVNNFNHLKVALFKFDGAIHGKDDLATIRLIGRCLNRFLDQQQQDSNDLDLTDDERDLMFDDLELSERVNNSIPKIMSQFRNLTENYQNFRSIIVLDNFDVFCRKQQTLLYNLLDLTQHGRSILVIGITRRLDYIELLEKRVRSRLTQRVVHLVSPFKQYDLYKTCCMSRIQRLCQENPTLETNFIANKSLIESELVRSFAINPNFNEINRIVFEYSFYHEPDDRNDNNFEMDNKENNKKTKLLSLITDPQIIAISRLKKNDLIFLMILLRHLRNEDVKIFTCADLFNWSIGCTLLRKTRMGLIIKSINNLINSDMIIFESDCYSRRKTSKQNIACVNKWTKLVPNVSEQHLEQFIKYFEHILPQAIKRLW
ncbi:origin recognition complex subunit 4 [Dermatophagoides farinae]|uniref:Origin recognition complex subunit 4 n=2 Tax=Dermatophagoides farinae TaxID=6954 RepID=A0A922HWJ2_DERFA|nr:origin recognition complex subunit 4 [Dermatophagoides farinae]